MQGPQLCVCVWGHYAEKGNEASQSLIYFYMQMCPRANPIESPREHLGLCSMSRTESKKILISKDFFSYLAHS